jgi:5'(3')-deoxyribonucleotidase
MKLGIDLDGCLYDFVQDYHDYLVEIEEVPEEDLAPATHWDFYQDYGYTVEDFMRHLTHGADTGRIFNRSGPTEGSVETLNELRSEGHTIHVITDRGRFGVSPMVDTAQWLHDFKIPFDSLTYSKDKTLMRLDLMVEDAPMNLTALMDAGIQAVRFRQPWNVDASADWFISEWADLPQVVTYAQDYLALREAVAR